MGDYSNPHEDMTVMKNPDVPDGSLEGLYQRLVITNQTIAKHIEVRKELLQAIAQTEESFSYKRDAEIHNFEQYIRNEFPDNSADGPMPPRF